MLKKIECSAQGQQLPTGGVQGRVLVSGSLFKFNCFKFCAELGMYKLQR